MRSIGYGSFHDGGVVEKAELRPDEVAVQMTPPGPSCSECHSYNMKKEAGCEQCLDCGHSKCG